MNRIDLFQLLQTVINIGVIACLVYLVTEVQQIERIPERVSYQEQITAIPSDDYLDVSALKCPSSYDEETRQFRNENYWIFQKKNDEKNISLVLRPNRDSGVWDRDVDVTGIAIVVSPDFYEWESVIFTGINVLNRKDLSLERKRSDRATAVSECELVSPEEARNAVESRYQSQLEGNKI